MIFSEKFEFKIDIAEYADDIYQYDDFIEEMKIILKKSKDDIKLFKEDCSIVVKVNDNKYHISYEDFIYGSKYDFDNLKAKMKNGLLTITVPIVKKTERQIEIE